MMNVLSINKTCIIEADRNLDEIKADWQKHINRQINKNAGKPAAGKQLYQLAVMLGVHISDHFYDMAQVEINKETKDWLMQCSDMIWEAYSQHFVYILSCFENKKPLKAIEDPDAFMNNVIFILNLTPGSGHVVEKFQKCYAVKLQRKEDQHECTGGVSK